MIYYIKKIFILNFLIAYLFSYAIAQTSFSPSDISDLKLWLRSDTAMTLSGNKVDQWNDISGNNNNAFQTINSIKPTWYPFDTLLNNFPAIKFDGVGSRLETMFIQPDAYSIFIIYAYRNGTNGSFYSTNQSGYPLQRNSVIWPNSNLAPYNLTGGDFLNTKNLYVDVHDFLNDSYSTYLNGISSGSSNNLISKSGGFFNIGSGGGEPLDGSIAEILIYTQALSDSLRSLVENYLMNKYAPSVNLGVDKTVCSFPITLKAKKKYFTNYIWQNNSIADSLVVNSPGKYYVTTTDIFNKISSDTIFISLSPPTFTASLGNDTIICNGQKLILNAGPDNLTYSWSNGVTTNTTIVTTQATYTVSVVDCSDNTTIDSIKVIVQPLPNFNFGSEDTIICINSNFILDPNFTTPSLFSYNWQDNTNSSTYSVSVDGKYYLEVTDAIGCKTSDTINIQIDASLNTISLGSDISLCAGNQIALIAGLQPGLSYTWSSGETTPAITVTNTAEYSVIITNTNNCIAKDTINVSITGQAPNPNFTFNQACINTPIQFTDASFAPSGNSIASYFWNFGDPLSASNTSTLSNPTHSYTNTGIYTVSLTISTDVGCSKSITKTLTVSPTPTVNFNFGIACQNSAVTFTGSINSGTLTTTAITWNFGDPASGANNSSALLNPSHVFSNQANYPVKLIAINSAGCKDSITKIVNVRGEVKADFTYSAPCANSNVLFQDNSITPAPSNVHTRTWNFSNSANTFIGLTTNQTFTNSGIYSASLTVTGTNGCVSSISKLITVQLKPVVNFTVPPLCAKDTVNIINNSSVGSGVFSSFNWQLNTNSFSSASSPTLSIANSGTYSLSLKITNSAQCADSLTKLITVLALPTVDFETNPPIYLFLDSTVTFIPNSTTGSFYQWEINSEVFNTVSPTYTFNTIGTYSVSLFMRDENGCGNSQLKTIRVFDHYLDLAIRDIITSLDNENFLRVKANLLNMGSVPISRFEISKRINSISDSKESWIGQLNPGNQLLYEFVSTNKLSNTADNKIICLQIESINLITDNNTTNNNLCVALKTNGNEVFEPYPNPSFKEDVIIPVLLTNDQIVSIELYNTVGEIVITTLNYTGTEGLNFIKIPSSELSRGTYLLKLTINEKIFMKKLMKN